MFNFFNLEQLAYTNLNDVKVIFPFEIPTGNGTNLIYHTRGFNKTCLPENDLGFLAVVAEHTEKGIVGVADNRRV